MNDSDSGPCTFHLWQKSPEWAWFSTVSAWSLNAPKSEIAHHFAKFRYTREWTIYTVYGKTDIHGLLAPAKLCLTYRPRADRTRTCPSTSSCFPWVISPVSLTEIIFFVSLLYSSHLCRDQNSLGQRGSYSSLCIVCIGKGGVSLLSLLMRSRSYHSHRNTDNLVWSELFFFKLKNIVFWNFKSSFFLVRALYSGNGF